MDLRSFITSFNSKLRYLFFSIMLLPFFIIVFDTIFFQIFFLQYDKLNQLSNINKPYDILIIGSSNILWAVDPKVIETNTAKKTGMISLAGGDIEFRYHALKEYLKRNKLRIPDKIIMHTDKYALSKGRYSGDSYKSIQGYYHKGLFVDYLDSKWKNEKSKNYLLKRVFKSYTLNSEFYFILTKYFDKIPITKFLALFFNNEVYAEDSSAKKINILTDKDSVQKIEKWKKEYQKIDESEKVDKEYREWFLKMIELINSYKVKVILLETPVFNMNNTSDDGYSSVRTLYSNVQNESIHYIRIKPEIFDNDISFYFDASHFNPIGRVNYSVELVKILQNMDRQKIHYKGKLN